VIAFARLLPSNEPGTSGASGRYLYKLGKQWVPCEVHGKTVVLRSTPPLPSWVLPKELQAPPTNPQNAQEREAEILKKLGYEQELQVAQVSKSAPVSTGHGSNGNEAKPEPAPSNVNPQLKHQHPAVGSAAAPGVRRLCGLCWMLIWPSRPSKRYACRTNRTCPQTPPPNRPSPASKDLFFDYVLYFATTGCLSLEEETVFFFRCPLTM
jgi:hypothetical protein